jgi:hypothetical protein
MTMAVGCQRMVRKPSCLLLCTTHHRPIMPSHLSLSKKPASNASWTAVADNDDDHIVSSFRGRVGKCVQFHCDGKRPDHLPRHQREVHCLSYAQSHPEVRHVLRRASIPETGRDSRWTLEYSTLWSLCWVLDNIFNVHGGVPFRFMLTSKDRIILTIKYCRF